MFCHLEDLHENFPGDPSIQHGQVLQRPEHISQLDHDVGQLTVAILSIYHGLQNGKRRVEGWRGGGIVVVILHGRRLRTTGPGTLVAGTEFVVVLSPTRLYRQRQRGRVVAATRSASRMNRLATFLLAILWEAVRGNTEGCKMKNLYST